MRNWRELGDLDQAVRYTFGMTLGQLEDEWRRDVRRRYGFLQAAANVGAIWFIAETDGAIYRISYETPDYIEE